MCFEATEKERVSVQTCFDLSNPFKNSSAKCSPLDKALKGLAGKSFVKKWRRTLLFDAPHRLIALYDPVKVNQGIIELLIRFFLVFWKTFANLQSVEIHLPKFHGQQDLKNCSRQPALNWKCTKHTVVRIYSFGRSASQNLCVSDSPHSQRVTGLWRHSWPQMQACRNTMTRPRLFFLFFFHRFLEDGASDLFKVRETLGT